MPPKKTRSTRTGRLAQIGGLASGQAARQVGTRTANLVRTDERAQAALEARNIEMADRLVTVLGTMRGAAMKLGQMLSLIDGGLVPESHREEFQAKLAALHNNAPKVRWMDMRELVERELGRPLRSAFAEFDTTPVAAASIGQVYRAVTHDGADVAVKVQYPGIDAAVAADLKNMGLLLKVYGKALFEGLDTASLVDELTARLTEELDYLQEARNTRALAEAFAGHPFIRIPSVREDLSSTRVLTTEWLDGKPLRTVIGAPLETRNLVAEILFRFYSGTPYWLGVYSGDPHPGNALVMDDGSIGFLDFGLVKEIDQTTADAELESMRATIDGDGPGLLRLLQERRFVVNPDKALAQDALDAMMRAGWWYFLDEEAELTPRNASTMAASFANPTARFGSLLLKQNIPAEHAFRARTEFQLVAVLGQLRPNLNLHRVAREWIYGEPPVTELGRQHQDWLLRRG